MERAIYLDYHATTPVDPRVSQEMFPFFQDDFGNAGSLSHGFGEKAAHAIDKSRQIVAKMIGAGSRSDVIFTSGATESNNIALQGVLKVLSKQGKSHVVSSAIEHKSVLDVLACLEDQKLIDVSYLSPDKDGCFKINAIRDALRPDTGLLSFMFVNNEIGIINPIKDIGELSRQHGLVFHCDATQAAGKLPINVDDLGVDLLSISAHKIYGPKGVGALYVRNSCRLEPIIYGGGQERGLRPGTLPVPLIVGLAKAFEVANLEMSAEAVRIRRMRDELLKGLSGGIKDIVVNGSMEQRLYNNLNISFLGVKSDTLMMNLWNDLAVSSGSACTSINWEGSYVLKAMGATSERVNSAIRFGLGRMTTDDEIAKAIPILRAAVAKLRA